MELTEVISQKEQGLFLEVPVDIYKGDPHWIRPLNQDIDAVFDKKKNKFFRHGVAARWILTKNGRLIGRVAAFVNRKTARSFEQPTGGLGFFECIHDQEAADLLFDKCREWLKEQGMEAMDGPINFGERDRWWGLLTDGFYEPTYCSNYNPVYYRELFENYGFQVYFEQYNYAFPADTFIPEKFRARDQRLSEDPKYHCEHIRKNNLVKYANDFRYIYNKAWGKHDNFKGMTEVQAMSLMKTMKPVMVEHLIWFAYYDQEPIGFFIMLPELNQIFKYLDGNFNWWGKLKFLYYRWKVNNRKVFGMAFGVIPTQQGKGVEGLIIMATAKKVQPMNKYDMLEMTWIGDFNPKMLNLVESLGATRCRTYFTYRFLFDRNKEFKRAPMIS